ncbi:MAG: hypothetical protein AAFZ49_02850 [Cyanobacteria bacterium J06659_2]
MTTKRLNTKNTKAEILTAYNDLINEKKSLEMQLVTAQKTVSHPAPNQNGKPQVTVIQEAILPEVTSTANPQGVESIIEDLTRLQFNFGGAASALSEQLTSEALKLQEIQDSIAEESQKLETLHDLQFADESLTTLIEEYETSDKAFREEFSQRQEELELEMGQASKVWVAEQEDHGRTVKSRNELQAKLRQRDAKEYNYGLTLQRRIADEDYDQTETQRYQEIEDLQAAQEKQWTEREQAIAEREQAFTDLKTKVEGFSEQLDKAIKKAKEEGRGIAHHQAKIKADLVAQEVEGQKRTYELRIESLQDKIETQGDRIENLSTQLNVALKQVQDLAVKAIDGAANLSSLKSIREIAIEQAKNPSKNK